MIVTPVRRRSLITVALAAGAAALTRLPGPTEAAPGNAVKLGAVNDGGDTSTRINGTSGGDQGTLHVENLYPELGGGIAIAAESGGDAVMALGKAGGTALHGESGDGYGLRIYGRAGFSHCGIAHFRKGQQKKRVFFDTFPLGIQPLVLATPQQGAGAGIGIASARVVPSLDRGIIDIALTAPASRGCDVVWFIVEPLVTGP